MPINGVDPLDSDNALNEFGSIVYSLIRRVNCYIGGPKDPEVAENSVLGDLVALAALCRVKKSAGDAMAKGQVAEWREKFLNWLESAKLKISKKYLDGYKANALSLFDELEGVAVKKPKMLWETRASHQGLT